MLPPIPAPDRLILAALRHARTPVVFLDFDGVTHVEPLRGPAFVHLPLIEEVLRAHPKVPTVLSTSWREEFRMEVLLEHFSKDIAARVIGGTPSMVAGHSRHYTVPLCEESRQAEIQAWLYENLTMAHPGITIDDSAFWFEPDCSNLLYADWNTGFTAADGERLYAMLQERSP